jgi:phenylpyruvate tautomerase PptA (4-oxalocrotonate tautomerase family)
MPFIDILPSTPLPAEDVRDGLIARVAELAAGHLHKPPSVLMVRLSPPGTVHFAGSGEPSCVVGVRLIGMPAPEVVARLNEALCAEVGGALGVPTKRIFVVFTDVPRSAWGVGGRMLG